MSRPRSIFPKYRKHPQTEKAVLDVYRQDGTRTSMTLPGAFGSDESKAEYQRVIDLLKAHGGRMPLEPGQAPADTTIFELAHRYLVEKLDIDYRKPGGGFTSEHLCCCQALKPLKRMFGPRCARDFDAVCLEAVRQSMISGAWMNDDERKKAKEAGRPIGWARKSINKHVSRLRGLFRWGVVRGLVPPTVVTALECLQPLKKGKGGARETKRVDAVAVDIVDKTLPKAPPFVADMIRVQLLTGCRPGELCSMRGRDLDRSGPIWVYVPQSHKTEHLEIDRAITIGPRGQLILRRYLGDDLDAYLFSPAKQAELIKEEKRKNRKTDVQPSQQDRSKPDAKRKPANRYRVTSYATAIRRACKRAGVASWHPHQLRHTTARLVSREHGSEAARATLGHREVNMTAHYSGLDRELSAEVAMAMG